MMEKIRTRTVMGQSIASANGADWSWSLDHRRYHWCPLGWLSVTIQGTPTVRVVWCKTVELAVAFTVGFHEGRGFADRTRTPELFA